MNLRQRGYCRDNAILQAVERRRALDTEQVRVMLFPFSCGQRKAQERLLKLYKGKRLDRDRAGDVYAYYRDQRPGKLRHLIGVNWVRLWLESRLKSWETLHSFEYEPDYGLLRADAFAAVKNVATGKMRFFFVEVDRATNGFDKVEKYCQLYESGGYRGRWWVELTDRFPAVLVVTTDPERAGLIQAAAKKENGAGLEFKVMLLDDIRKEVMKKCKGC
ncbi:MAG: replication-relaxation family protein [Eubacteriales bacterium]